MATTAQPASMPRRASLLGLPRELRLQIYDHVFALDLDHIILRKAKRLLTKKEREAAAESNNDQALSIPWLNLMLACKSTAVELRSLMQEANSSRTYVLDLEATRAGKNLGKTVWRHLPCGPDQAEYLEVYYNASRGFRAWGNGGPHSIVNSLYQTLNHLIHCGPRMFDSKTPLPQPMHLKELRIIIESRGVDELSDREKRSMSDRERDPEITALSLGSIVGQITNTGVLVGFVDNIRLRSSKTALSWAVNEVEGSGIPDLWSGYGFEWGV